MSDAHGPFGTRQTFDPGAGKLGHFYSLPQLEKAGDWSGFQTARLHPPGARIGAAQLRRQKGHRANVRALANWKPNEPRTEEIPFVVARIVLQDFTGVPLLVDLAAMRRRRGAHGQGPENRRAARAGGFGRGSLRAGGFRGHARTLCRRIWRWNSRRNRERYQFLKWGMQAFDTFKVVPPGIGIVHQVNLEYLAKGVLSAESRTSDLKSQFYPDTLVGTDSHTTMINGIGIVGWGVGGIEAEAGMLGQPVYFLTPDVVGVHLTGAIARRRHGHRPRAHRHANAAQGEGRRQICGIFRSRRGGAAGRGPRDDCQHGARIRRDDGLFPDGRRVRELPPGHGPQRGTLPDLRELLPRAGPVRHSEEGRHRVFAGTGTGPRLGDAERGRPEAAAGPHRVAEVEKRFPWIARLDPSRKMVLASGPKTCM